MIPNPIYRPSLILLLFCLLGIPVAKAQIFLREYLNTSTGFPHTDIVVVEDDRFIELNTGTGVNFRDKEAYALVGIGLDPDLNLCHAQAIHYRVNLRSDETVIATPGSPTVQTNYYTLDVTYDPLLRKTETEQAYIQVTNARRVKISIIDVRSVAPNGTETVIGSPGTLPADLYVEGEIYRERYDDFNPTSIPVITAPTSAELLQYQDDNVFLLKWNNVNGAVEYEIEWTYVDDYGTTGYTSAKPTNQITVLFKNNSTRVRVKRNAQNRYFIPKIYAKGYVVVRVRGIGRGGTLLDDDIFGRWSWDNGNAGTLLSTVPSQMYFVSANQNSNASGQVFNNLNALHNLTFAEEGKLLASTLYADGTQRVRQKTMPVKATDANPYGKMALISEIIYDHMGRPAIKTLPAVTKQGIWYTPNYNKNATGVKYSYKDFDTDQQLSGSGCLTGAAPMNTISGSSNYYSSANAYKAEQQAWVPDAGSYPFTQTIFERDNSNKPKVMGEAGPDFRIGSGHETKHIYGGAGQTELNRLFGTDAGYASYYQKNMVQDPNGQINITYTDMSGRTVATALAGRVPGNLTALTDSLGDTLSVAGDVVTEDLLNKSTNFPNGASNLLSADGRAFTFSTNLLITSEQEYVFSYSMEMATVADSCFPNLCMDCVYDLEVSLTDDCGNFLIGNANLTGPLLQQIGGQLLDTLCNDTTGFALWAPDIAVVLKPGQYTLTKKLSINENALNFYLDKMMSNSICLLDPNYFYQVPDLSGCEITCEECLENIGTWEDFYDDHKGEFNGDDSLATLVLTQAYQALKAECEDLCTDRSRDLCATAYELMLMDMSPGGQYAEYDDNGSGISTSSYPLSIFNPSSKLPLKLSGQFNAPPASAGAIAAISSAGPTWRKPLYYDHENLTEPYKTGYYDEFGVRVKVYVEKDVNDNFVPAVVNSSLVYPVNVANNEYYTYPENLQNELDFINRWQPSFAKSLTIWHPEFFQYEWCVSNYRYTKTLALTSGPVTVNTFDFDQQLSDMNALQAATLFPASNASQLFTALMAADPFFASNPQASTSYLMTINAIWIMQNKWNAFQNFFPLPLIMNLPQAAYATNHCGYNPLCSMPSNIWGPGGLLTNDNDWATFTSFYVSAKQNAMTVTQNLYAHFGSPTNPTPWKRVSGQCIGSSSYFPIYEFITFINSGGSILFKENPCQPFTFQYFQQKARRFGQSASQISDHYELSDPPSAAELQQYSDQGYFQQTGKCPLARDLEIVMNQLATNGTLTTAYVDLMQGPYLGSALYNALGSTSNTAIGYSGSVSGATLSATVSAANTCPNPLTLNLPADAVTLGYTFNDIQTIFNLGNIAQVGGNYTFQVRAIVFNTSISAQPDTFLLTGSTCLALTGCEASFQSVCKPTKEARDLANLMSALSQNNILFNTTATNISAYSPLLTPRLLFYLGSGGTYTWQYNTTGPTFTLTNTATSQAIRLNVSTLGLNPTKQYQFTTIAGPSVTTPTSGPNSQFNFTATELVPGSYNPLGNQTFGSTTATMSGAAQTINFGQSFPITECEEIKPLECSTAEHQNREDLQEIFENWIALQSGGYVPEAIIDTCLDQLELASGNPFDITAIVSIVSLEADMSQSPNTVNSHYFKAVVKFINDVTDTLYGYYCLPMRNCETCEEADSCRGDITLIVKFPDGFVPVASDIYVLRNLNDCIRLSQKPFAYNHTSAQAYWEDYAIMLETLNSGVSVHATNGVLYITFDPDVYAARCPCTIPREYVLLNQKTENTIATFTTGCCQTAPPCNDIVLRIPLPSVEDLQKYGGFGITPQNDRCIRIRPGSFDLTGSTLATYWTDYAAAININTVGANATVVGGELVIRFDAGRYGEQCPCNEGFGFNLLNRKGVVLSTYRSGCCTDAQQPPCQPGDALFSFTFTQQPRREDIYRLAGDLAKCPDMKPSRYTYNHSSLADFLTDWANEITIQTPGVYASASGNTLNIRITATALKECVCDRMEGSVRLTRGSEIVEQIDAKGSCCGTPGTPQGLIVPGGTASGTRKNRRPADPGDATPIRSPKMLQTEAEEEGPWEPWTELTTPTDCHPEIVPFPPDSPQTNPCIVFLMETAGVNAKFAYDEYLAQKREEYKQLYIAHCMQVLETFERKYTENEYHYTLYYYDRAGNLVKTVPPHAVTPLTGAELASVNTARDNGTVVVPVHNRALVSGSTPRAFALGTRYRYNTLNLVIEQMTPDAGKAFFFYDRIARLVLTRNAKQIAQSSSGAYKYTYSLFDSQSRTTETGEMTHSTQATRAMLYGPTGTVYMVPVNYTTEDVVQTVYDNNPTPPGGFVQEHLRSRVAYVRRKPKGETAFVFASYFNYDFHGAVKNLLQENQKAPVGLTFNQVDYGYDIISGNVLKVTYNPDKPDQNIHRYEYDDQNRLTNVYTSRDGVRYEMDARYFYFRHGNLARAELGQNKVQGQDYRYTIRGWQKGMNSDGLQTGHDPSQDGYNNPGNPNRYFARDAYGFSLNYHNTDYVPIGSSTAVPSPALPVGYITGELWNGNIAAMNNTLKKPGDYTILPLLQRFRHDQLNRIVSGEALNDLNLVYNLWNLTPTPLREYRSTYAYDQAGNLDHIDRNGNKIDSLDMDSLDYEYYPKTNRLRRVIDYVDASRYTEDIDDQSMFTDNYAYDEIGNMVKDQAEEIDRIEWDVYGKIHKIIRTSVSQKPDLEFRYDPSGQRVLKTRIPKDGSATVSDYYVYDATGHVLAIYTYSQSGGNETYRVDEQPLYGRSRLGGRKPELELLSYIPAMPVIHQVRRGEKRYELVNHLGNIHSVVSDRKKRVCESGVFSYYEPDIRLTYDYYPFGMLMPGRSFEAETVCDTLYIPQNDTVQRQTFDSGLGGFVGSFTRGFTLENQSGQLFANGTLTAIEVGTGNVSYSSGWYIRGGYSLSSGTGYTLALDVTVCANDTVICQVWDSTPTLLGSYTVTASGTIHIPFTTATTGNISINLEKYNGSACGFWIDNLFIYTQNGVDTVIDCGQDSYRYGYNGKEKDDEVKGEGIVYDYGFRIQDARLGRFFSMDPLTRNYPQLTPYQYASNMPIWAIDLDGLEAYFTTDGKFDHWGETKGKDAPVIIIAKAGDTQGTTLKNNSTDFKGKDITVGQFIKRAQRVYGEGGSDPEASDYYAHAQDNFRKKTGGKEAANYSYMKYQDFDVSSGYSSYNRWNDKRGTGYDNLAGLNNLEGASNAIAAEARLLMGTTTDKTSGATQWRGHGLNEYVDPKAKVKVLWSDKWAEDMEKAKTDPKILESYGLSGRVVESYFILKTKTRVHLFFKPVPPPAPTPEKK